MPTSGVLYVRFSGVKLQQSFIAIIVISYRLQDDGVQLSGSHLESLMCSYNQTIADARAILTVSSLTCLLVDAGLWL